jgi:hypothetical protein
MINSTLEKQAKSSDELMRRLIEEWDEKKLVDSNLPLSSPCDFNFPQTNPQPSGTSASGTSQPNLSVFSAPVRIGWSGSRVLVLRWSCELQSTQ